MSYTKMGYTKSIYGIIADAIKEELKIYFLKSDYFYNKDCINWKQELLMSCLISVRVETYTHVARFLRHNVW